MQIALLLPDEADRSRIMLAAPPGTHITCCDSPEALVPLVGWTLDAIIYEPGMGLMLLSHLLNRTVALGVHLVVRTDFRASQIAEFRALAKQLPSIGVSLKWPRVSSDGERQLFESLTEPDGGPTATAFNYVADALSEEGRILVATSLVLGGSHHEASSHVAAELLVARSQATFGRRTLPAPDKLLLWSQAVWCAWRMYCWGMTYKQAAFAGGFGNARTMSTALKPFLAFGSPERVITRGFDCLLNESFEEGSRRNRASARNRQGDFSR